MIGAGTFVKIQEQEVPGAETFTKKHGLGYQDLEITNSSASLIRFSNFSSAKRCHDFGDPRCEQLRESFFDISCIRAVPQSISCDLEHPAEVSSRLVRYSISSKLCALVVVSAFMS